MYWREFAQTISITLAAIVASMVLFGVFMFAFAGVSPINLYYWMFVGAFGSSFSCQNARKSFSAGKFGNRS